MDLGPVGPKLLFLFNLLAREGIKWLTLGVPPSPRFYISRISKGSPAPTFKLSTKFSLHNVSTSVHN